MPWSPQEGLGAPTVGRVRMVRRTTVNKQMDYCKCRQKCGSVGKDITCIEMDRGDAVWRIHKVGKSVRL